MSARGRQQYYAALVKEAAARRALEKQEYEEGPMMSDIAYEDIGRKAVAAVTNLLDVLSGPRVPHSGVDLAVLRSAIQDSLSAISNEINQVRRDYQAVTARTDRVLLELYQRVEEQGEALSRISQSIGHSLAEKPSEVHYITQPKKRVPKQEVREKLLAAAKKMDRDGKKLTLAECARMACVPYHKAVYASRDFHELTRVLSDSGSQGA